MTSPTVGPTCTSCIGTSLDRRAQRALRRPGSRLPVPTSTRSSATGSTPAVPPVRLRWLLSPTTGLRLHSTALSQRPNVAVVFDNCRWSAPATVSFTPSPHTSREHQADGLDWRYLRDDARRCRPRAYSHLHGSTRHPLERFHSIPGPTRARRSQGRECVLHLRPAPRRADGGYQGHQSFGTPHPRNERRAWRRQPGRPHRWDVRPHPQSKLPGVIEPLDTAEAYMLASGLKQVGVDLTRPIRGGVSSATTRCRGLRRRSSGAKTC